MGKTQKKRLASKGFIPMGTLLLRYLAPLFIVILLIARGVKKTSPTPKFTGVVITKERYVKLDEEDGEMIRSGSLITLAPINGTSERKLIHTNDSIAHHYSLGDTVRLSWTKKNGWTKLP